MAVRMVQVRSCLFEHLAQASLSKMFKQTAAHSHGRSDLSCCSFEYDCTKVVCTPLAAFYLHRHGTTLSTPDDPCWLHQHSMCPSS
jgi:hypothetical protein